MGRGVVYGLGLRVLVYGFRVWEAFSSELDFWEDLKGRTPLMVPYTTIG